MKLAVYNMDHKVLKELDVDEQIAAQQLRPDILHRVVEWQRSRWRAGTHATKGISQISGTTKKPFKQKGTGNARQGSLRSPQFRGGAVIFGPVVRSHEYSLPKKVRKLGLRVAISQKINESNLKVLDTYPQSILKTTNAAVKLAEFAQGKSALVVYSAEQDDTAFLKAVRNIKGVNIIPVAGVNVYDLLKQEIVLFSESTFNAMQERLK